MELTQNNLQAPRIFNPLCWNDYTRYQVEKSHISGNTLILL